ncbi:TraB/GumN family protein [Desulfuromonas thiophila]|uniref:Pheromone shutdown-related protein TraB n=1 Tax=Desulfuromonas thiophila TaxID=57664 RepID=A0A1G7DUY0_9BACT|nr:TraB/GumN family protein [Desulfuromonas thiophila]SDE55000.1 pheromone shutdown-related protein TraB [Desulfuromonas thiophila]
MSSTVPERATEAPTATGDLHRIHHNGREILLVGTAHISRASVEMVQHTIATEQPDAVCVELDAQRYAHLTERNRWEQLNIRQVIRQGQIPFLMANLALASFQKRMGLQTGVRPGEELAAAAQAAEERSLPVHLIDRDIRTTLLRAWRKTGLWQKIQLVTTLFAGLFEKHEIDEEELARLRQSDSLSSMLEEMGDLLPAAKSILVDERDRWMAHQLRQTAGARIVAVVGAAHIPGICRHLAHNESDAALAELASIPVKPLYSRLLPWLIPLLVAALFVIGFFFADREQLYQAAGAWILANGSLSALGTLVAWGHPLTVVAAFVAAPITSLNPTIGAGFVTAFVQALLVPPKVRDMEAVLEAVVTLSGWWRNRLTRILLVFFLSSLGSSLGTLVAFGWLKQLL